MRKLLIITCIALGLALTGCMDYVEPRDTHITVEESAQDTESELQTETDKVIETETETLTEALNAFESETETERETTTVWVTQGVNIRSQQTKLSDRLGGAVLGDSFDAYIDTLDDEFVEILFKGERAYAYRPCLTTNYDDVARIKAEIAEANRRQAQTETQVQTVATTETQVPETETFITEIASESETETETQTQTEAPASTAVYTPEYFKQAGVLTWGGSKWTWYTQRILPGEGLYIPGRHLDENGYVCDENNYIVCAADLSYIPRYTVIETPLGKLGKIYDTGCAYGVVDIYVDWVP